MKDINLMLMNVNYEMDYLFKKLAVNDINEYFNTYFVVKYDENIKKGGAFIEKKETFFEITVNPRFHEDYIKFLILHEIGHTSPKTNEIKVKRGINCIDNIDSPKELFCDRFAKDYYNYFNYKVPIDKYKFNEKSQDLIKIYNELKETEVLIGKIKKNNEPIKIRLSECSEVNIYKSVHFAKKYAYFWQFKYNNYNISRDIYLYINSGINVYDVIDIREPDSIMFYHYNFQLHSKINDGKIIYLTKK